MIKGVLETIENALLVTLAIGITLVVFYGVLVRYLPFPGSQMAWTEEVSLLLLVWLVFLGAAAVHRERGHFSVNLLLEQLPRRFSMTATLLCEVAMMAFLVFVAINALALVKLEALNRSIILNFPLFLIPLALFISCCLMIIYSGIAIIAAFRRRHD